MTDEIFDLNVFLSMPSEILVSQAAAKLLDVLAIQMDAPAARCAAGLFAYHMNSVAVEIEQRRAELAGMDGGAFSRDYPNGLATMDVKLPGYERVSAICTVSECEEAHMDLEDFINHMGSKLTHLS